MNTKRAVGAAIIVAGVAAGILIAIWWGLYGGITQFVDGVTADPTRASDIAAGALRFMFGPTLGWVAAVFLVTTGAEIFEHTPIRHGRPRYDINRRRPR